MKPNAFRVLRTTCSASRTELAIALPRDEAVCDSVTVIWIVKRPSQSIIATMYKRAFIALARNRDGTLAWN